MDLRLADCDLLDMQAVWRVRDEFFPPGGQKAR